MQGDKRLGRVSGRHAASGAALAGYEIHLGVSDGPDRARPFALIDGSPEGAVSANGRIIGTYLHGLFGQDGFRRAFLASLGAQPGTASYAGVVDQTLDALASHLGTFLDLDSLFARARPGLPSAPGGRSGDR